MDMVKTKIRLLSIIERLGYHVVPMKQYRPVDLRASSEHPLTAAYRYPGRRLLINAPVKWGVGLFHYPLDRPPVLQGLIPPSLESSAHVEELLRERLCAFYRDWQPSTAAAFLGLPDSEIPALKNVPPWGVPWPWEPHDIDRRSALRRSTVARENANVLGRKLSIDHGWKFCGPVTDEKLEVEVERLMRLIKSIRLNGVQRQDGFDGDMSATLLCNTEGEWRWQLLSGQHRFAVMASIGIDVLPIRVDSFVRGNEVEHWTGVVSGIYSSRTAMKLFDRFFECLPRK